MSKKVPTSQRQVPVHMTAPALVEGVVDGLLALDLHAPALQVGPNALQHVVPVPLACTRPYPSIKTFAQIQYRSQRTWCIASCGSDSAACMTFAKRSYITQLESHGCKSSGLSARSPFLDHEGCTCFDGGLQLAQAGGDLRVHLALPRGVLRERVPVCAERLADLHSKRGFMT